jgi:fructokinase
MDRYQLQEDVLTKGGKGATNYTPTSRHDYKAFSVQVKDTVGSGDSFLAAFIAQKLLGKSIDDTVEYATALGAYVTTHAGANPPYKMTDLNHFIWKKTLERMNWKY